MQSSAELETCVVRDLRIQISLEERGEVGTNSSRHLRVSARSGVHENCVELPFPVLVLEDRLNLATFEVNWKGCGWGAGVKVVARHSFAGVRVEYLGNECRVTWLAARFQSSSEFLTQRRGAH